jgi:hypothetical protein
MKFIATIYVDDTEKSYKAVELYKKSVWAFTGL